MHRAAQVPASCGLVSLYNADGINLVKVPAAESSQVWTMRKGNSLLSAVRDLNLKRLV